MSVANQDKIFLRNENIVRRNIADEIILVPIRGNMADMKKVFSLDTVADFIWMQLDGTRSCGDIRAALLAGFTVDTDQATADLDSFIGELLNAGLIREAA